jgi:hypothetical protein
MSEDVLVDTNVLLAVLNSDADWGHWSEQRLSQFANRLVINPIIYTELCYTAAGVEQADTAVNILGLAFKEMSKEALFFNRSSLPNLSRKRRNKNGPSGGFFHRCPCPSFKNPNFDTRHRTIPFVFPERSPYLPVALGTPNKSRRHRSVLL